MVAAQRPFRLACASQSPRLGLLAAILVSVATTVLTVATAADPDSGTLSLNNTRLTWTGQADGRAYAYLEPRIECTPEILADCDRYTLTVDIDPAHWRATAAAPRSSSRGPTRQTTSTSRSTAEPSWIGQSARGDTTSERVFIPTPSREDGEYTVLVSPWSVDDPNYGGGIRLESRPVFDGPTGGDVPNERLSGVKCEDGMAGPFPCQNVDLAAFLPVSELGGSRPLPDGVEPTISDLVNDNLNDIWGWTDPETGREYALVGKTDGTAFVDITDPENPVYRGQLVSRQNVGDLAPVETIFKNWRDLKVYEDHVFIGSEEPAHGLQVFDLRRLRGETPATGLWTQDADL